MKLQIGWEDPAQPDIMELLKEGELYSASLYPADSNHHLSLEALRASHIRFLVARDDSRAVATGALALFGCWAELKRMWVVPAMRGRGISKAILEALEARQGKSRWAGSGWRLA